MSCALCCVRWASSPPLLSWRSSCNAWMPTRCTGQRVLRVFLRGQGTLPVEGRCLAEQRCQGAKQPRCGFCPSENVLSCCAWSAHQPLLHAPRLQDGLICFDEFEAAMAGQAEDEETERQLREVRVRQQGLIALVGLGARPE